VVELHAGSWKLEAGSWELGADGTRPTNHAIGTNGFAPPLVTLVSRSSTTFATVGPYQLLKEFI